MQWRKLTPIECERLQGLSDNYTEGVSNSQRYKMIGNGWQCNTVEHIFQYFTDEMCPICFNESQLCESEYQSSECALIEKQMKEW